MPKTESRIPCEVCGYNLKNTPSNVPQHMRLRHGVYKGRGRPRNGTVPNIQGFRRMNGFVLLEDDQGGLWLAERIK